MVALAFASCEKPVIENDAKKGHEPDANVTLRFTAYQQEGFTRSTEALSDQLTRLSVAVFRTDGTKAKSINQNAGDAGFGTVALSLATGSYKIVAVAHNGLGSATITSTEKVTFPSNKTTDTFAYYGTLTVGENPVNETLEMTRRVAMVRLTLTDNQLPGGVTKMKFYYTGGSSTYSPVTGYGCVNSKQTEYRDALASDGSPVRTYEIYTLPHEENDVLKLTITAQDAAGGDLYAYTMENIPVTRNKITTWTGNLFGGETGGGTVSDGGISLTLDTAWSGTISYTW